jgi:hypothetical protein
MSIHTLGRALRNLRNRVQVDASFHRGREFVPGHGGRLYIETSSLCNLKCRFCAYDKKASPRVSMEDEFFRACVEQAVEMGLVRYHLTPCTGDVFMDPGLFSKLAFLDAHPRVDWYDFFTNFTIPSEEDIERLLALEKLASLKVSVYGHDSASFQAITRSTDKVYRRLLANLEALLARLERVRFRLSIGLRSSRSVPRDGSSELLALLRRFRKAGVPVGTKHVYNNWGGYITQEDVLGLDIDVTDTRSTYKRGACTLLFTGVQVMATGIVNGCACRDVDATLRIGDLRTAPLSAILSTGNPAYRELILEQQRGQFRPVCLGCDFYKSIYRITSAQRRRGDLKTLKEFLEQPYGSAAARPVARTGVP